MPLFSYCNESEEEELEMIAEFWMSDTRKQVFLGIQLRTSTSETSFSMQKGMPGSCMNT